jgi:hypothetical protein
MSITLNSDYKIVAQKAIEKIKLDVLEAITSKFSPQAVKKGCSITVPLVGNKKAVPFCPVLLDQSSDSFIPLPDIEITNDKLADFAAEDMYAVAKKVINHAFSKVTAANYKREYMVTAASFSISDIVKLIQLAITSGFSKGSIVLNTEVYGALLNNNNHILQGKNIFKFMNFDIMGYADLPNNSENLVGMILNPVAIACASSPVLSPEHLKTQMQVVTSTNTGISMGLIKFYDNNSGKTYQGVHLIHGSIATQSDSLIRIVTTHIKTNQK